MIELKDIGEIMEDIYSELKKVIVEQDELLELILISLLSGGHVLLEGVPGLAKTLTVRALAKTLSLDSKRVQFTPDLMPADITGTRIFNMQDKSFELKKGPVFTNLLLGDEINRTPPKTQAGILEAMEEGTVTIDGITHRLPDPYMVIATQNPIEYEGTYPLPEVLVDRFLVKIVLDYPSKDAESEVLKRHHEGFSNNDLNQSGISSVCTAEDIRECRENVQGVKVDEDLINYIVNIIDASRKNSAVDIGSSPRGSIALLKLSKSRAAYKGRDYVLPEDVKKMAVPALRHRIILNPELELEGVSSKQVLSRVLDSIEVPR